MSKAISCRRFWRIMLPAMVSIGFMSACQQLDSIHDSPDFYRHSYSQLSTPMSGEGGYYWFDVKLTPEFPDNNDAAEAVRMQWLEEWLAIRKTCLPGFEVLERRPFDFLEHNPGQYDLRYKVTCLVVPPAPAT